MPAGSTYAPHIRKLVLPHERYALVERKGVAIAPAILLFAVFAVGCGAPERDADRERSRPLRVNGSTTVNAVVAEAAEILRTERAMRITVDTQGGSSGGISGVGEGSVDVGMTSKPLSDDDRARWPGADLVATEIGADAVALVVSGDVGKSIQSLNAEQVRAIYEGRVTNWSEVGGSDQRIVFLNKEPGRGTWEVFATWLYGDSKKAPAVKHAEVGGNEEGRTKVTTTAGAISQLSSSWAEGSDSILALGIELADGSVVRPTPRDIRDGRYPMARPLLLITNGPPADGARVLIDFILSERGQQLMTKHGYLGVEPVN